MAFGCSQAQEIKNCIWTEIGQMRVKTGQRPAPSARTDTEPSAGISAASRQKPEWDQLPNASGDRPSELRIAMALARPFWKGSLSWGSKIARRNTITSLGWFFVDSGWALHTRASACAGAL